MKRARKKNSSRNKQPEKRELSGYQSDMLDLGYDPEAAIENEEDTALGDTAPEESEKLSEEAEAALGEEDEAVENTDNTNDDDDTADDVPPPKKSGFKGKKPLIFIASLITMVLLFVAALGFGGFFAPAEEEPEDSYTVPVDKATGKINVLVLGVDKDGLRTDTMIVANYDLDTNTVKLLSIPRDTRMYIGNKYQKINAAHALSQNGKIKGVQGSIEAVTRLTAIPINYYVEFSFNAFRNTIDALGGIDFDVPQNMNYEDPVQDLYIHLKKGYQHLDGDKAEQLVRFRRYPMGDLGRVEMQQAFIKALAEQKLNMGIVDKLPDLYNVLKEDITTNFTLLDMTKYANNLKELSTENITMFQLPGNFSGGEYAASYWIADMDQVKTLIETEFGYDASNATIHSADGSSISKDSADRKKTQTPKATDKTANVSETKKPTSKPGNTASAPAHTASNTKAPSHTASPTHKTEAPAASDTPQKTAVPTEKPTEKPAEKPTANPTQRPARPTPNVSENE